MHIIGIDPGTSGSIAHMSNGVITAIYDMPYISIRRGKSDKREIDGYGLGTLLKSLSINIACIEQVGGITGQSASAAFNFGRAAAAPEYALKALGIRVERVVPQAWRRYLRVPKGKDGSIARASTLWPDHQHKWAPIRGNGPAALREGRAEACLIAQYIYEKEQGRSYDLFS